MRTYVLPLASPGFLIEAGRARGTDSPPRLRRLGPGSFFAAGKIPLSIKARLAPAVYRMAHLSRLSRVRARSIPRIRVLMIHGVGGPTYPASVFSKQMDYLKRNFDLLSVDDVVEELREGTVKRRRPGIAITFDDGLRNLLSIAYPILSEREIPFTVFVCPGIIDGRRWLWNAEVRERLGGLSLDEQRVLAGTIGAPRGDPDSVVEWMKDLAALRRRAIEERIQDRTRDFRPSEAQRLANDLMTWEDLKTLSPRIASIGSHSMSHAILPRLDADGLRIELEESRKRIEEVVGRPAEHFAYPNGSEDDGTVSMVRVFYGSGWSVRPGFVEPGDDLYLLNRIPMPRSLVQLSWRLHRPG